MANTKIPVELSSTPGIVDNSNTTAITIDSSENVGIGTTNPSAKIDASGTYRMQLRTDDAVPEVRSITTNGAAFKELGLNGLDLRFFTSSSERMRIDSSGNVGIGTTSFSSNSYVRELVVKNTTTDGVSRYILTTTDNGLGASIALSSYLNENALTFGLQTSYDEDGIYPPTERMRIDSSGNVGIGTSSPAQKLDISGGHLRLDDARRIRFGGGTAAIEGSGSSNILSLITNNTERMRIDSSGNVGIGTSSPDPVADLHVADTSDARIYLDATSADRMELYSGIGVGMYNKSNSHLILGTNNTERLRIDSSGRLLVGTTSVLGSGKVSIKYASNTQTGIAIQSTIESFNTAIQFLNTAGTQVGTINTSTSSTTYNTSSDARLKDVTGEARGLEVINELNPVAYNWKADGKADEGLIAQEVKELVPNAVSGSEEDMYQMDYSKLVVHLVAGMKEQQTLIESLEARITALES